MKEIQYLGIRKTGCIDKRYGTEGTHSYSIFECPICSKQYELATSRGKKQVTCKECRGLQNTRHGKAGTKLYNVWQSMLQRCNNPKSQKYHIYGGKGICVDPKWNTWEGFWEDMGSSYEEGLTIDREDSSKDYTKSNCRWITLSQNSSETTARVAVIQLRKVLVPVVHFVEVQEWESASKAAETLGLIPNKICRVCKGNAKTHGGFGWKYK